MYLLLNDLARMLHTCMYVEQRLNREAPRKGGMRAPVQPVRPICVNLSTPATFKQITYKLL
jgi:hypothetical protein